MGSVFILLSTVALLLAIPLYLFVPFGKAYLAGSAVLGGLFLWSSIRLWMRPEKQRAWLNFKFSGIYLFGLLMAMAFDILMQSG
ncbi:MAG: hypothetical protein HYX90_06290 [Chloroflexi bacterium]|nr:hypothetical protein [Chloroflexota bacterium]